MNKPLTRSQIAALKIEHADMLERATSPAKRHNGPFSKTVKGIARRVARRNIIKAKRAWFAD